MEGRDSRCSLGEFWDLYFYPVCKKPLKFSKAFEQEKHCCPEFKVALTVWGE